MGSEGCVEILDNVIVKESNLTQPSDSLIY